GCGAGDGDVSRTGRRRVMHNVMDALAELQAADEAIETAGPLYQTREPLKDKIVCLIGQRADLITQVLALRRDLDAAHARTRDLEAALRETHDALERLDAIYASEHDHDPVLGTVLRPAWLADALHHARTLL